MRKVREKEPLPEAVVVASLTEPELVLSSQRLTVSFGLYPVPLAPTSPSFDADDLFKVNPSGPGVPGEPVAVGVGVVPPPGGSTQNTHFALKLLSPELFFAFTCHAYCP